MNTNIEVEADQNGAMATNMLHRNHPLVKFLRHLPFVRIESSLVEHDPKNWVHIRIGFKSHN